MQALALVLVSRCSIRDFLALPSSRLDLDSNGKLDARELEAAVAKLCEDGDISLATAQNYNNIIGRFDSNGSGDLDYEEFEQMIKKMLRIPHSRVMLRSTSIPQPQRYTTKSMWLSTLRNFPQSEVLRGIAQPLFAVVAVGLAVALVASLPSLSTWTRPRYELAKSLAQMHSLLGGALSLLLVFRTNAAYNRFWEARRIWESITNRCRDLARFGFVYRRSLGERRLTHFAQLVCAYPVALRRHLTGGSRRHASQQPAPLPPLPPPMVRALRRAANRPLYVCKRLAYEIGKVPESSSFSSRERLAAQSLINKLASYVGACERLVQTPVPLNYARHTSRFLTLWCLTLPISLVSSMGFAVVPVCAFITWCLFGIQEIGLFIEDCALVDGTIFMDNIADLVGEDVVEAIQPDELVGWEATEADTEWLLPSPNWS